MGCNCEGNKYLISCCTEQVLGPIENYYTKYQVDKLISGITVSGVTEEEMNEAISAATDGLASEEYVNNQISSQTADFVDGEELSSYTYDKATIDSKITSGGTFDPTQYYNKTATDALLAKKLDASAYTPTDLSNYYNKQEVDAEITEATSGKAETTAVTAINSSLTAHTANTNIHVTTSEKNTWNNKQNKLTAGTGIDITNNVISATGGTTYTAGRGINIDGSNVISFNLPISAGTGSDALIYNYSNTASGSYSHAEGFSTQANGYNSHAEGSQTQANEFCSHAEGSETQANGYDSHAEGSGSKADGSYSHAEGYGTQANNESEHASGQFNVSNSASTTFGDSGNTLFSVGNGNWFSRHNAFEIRQNGDMYISLGGQDVKLQDYLVKIWKGTKAEFDAITEKDNNTIYLVTN